MLKQTGKYNFTATEFFGMSNEVKFPTPDEIKAVKGRAFLLDKTTKIHFNALVMRHLCAITEKADAYDEQE